MIYADIKGKTHIPEDVLTSNCIELLSLLPDSNLIDFFSMSVNLEGTNINLSEYDKVERIEFWPWLRNGGEPDVLCILKNQKISMRIVLIIEAKHGAAKSSHAQTEVPPLEETTISGDQLAKYWQAANLEYDNVVLIYLTHHRHFPKQDVEDSVKETGNLALIYWVSWFHLYQFIISKYDDPEYTQVEINILGKLQIYLEDKGYIRFQAWEMPSTSVKRAYYHRVYSRPARHIVNDIYVRLYDIEARSSRINLLHYSRV